MTFNNIIGISGVAGSGKDTFVDLLRNNLPNVKRFALADSLKAEINPTLIQLYGTDIFNCPRADKNIVRPVLVAHGRVMREKTNGRYWIEKLNNKINEYQFNNPDHIICITDIRYDEYAKDEVSWVKEELGGLLVHVSRFEPRDGGKRLFLEPPNADEAKNDPKLISKADYRVIWPSAKKIGGSIDINSLNIYAEEFIKWLRR